MNLEYDLRCQKNRDKIRNIKYYNVNFDKDKRNIDSNSKQKNIIEEKEEI